MPRARLAPTLPSLSLPNTHLPRLPRGEGACQVPGEDIPAQYEQGGGRARTLSSFFPSREVELGVQAWHLPLERSAGAWGWLGKCTGAKAGSGGGVWGRRAKANGCKIRYFTSLH